MPAAVELIAGDPAAVAAAGRTFSSIADEVARHAARLRSMSSSSSAWSGKAAAAAHARSVTLPPKLDKVTASYGGAGQSLLDYAHALADAQQRSAAAIAAATRADADLQSARAAQANAAELDAQAASAAGSTGQPAPAPTAPRYQASVDEAASRLARAAAANAQAQADQDSAAARAAARLKAASHAGIRNQSWWQHFTHSVAHWTATHWREALAELSSLAGKISMLASVAAIVLAVAGIFFPPLEAAAAATQSIAFVSGMVSNVSGAVVQLSDKRSRKAGVVSLGMMLVPRAASKFMRRMPLMAHSGVFSAVRGGPQRGVPLGFPNEDEFKRFGATLQARLKARAEPDIVPLMQGSSVTGVSYTKGIPFDRDHSDYDVALCSPHLLNTAARERIPLWGSDTRSAPLDADDPELLKRIGLYGVHLELTRMAGCPVNFRIYKDVPTALDRGKSMWIPG